MKYIAIINTDEPLTEQTIQSIKDTLFFGDEQAPYAFEIEDIKYTEESAHDVAQEFVKDNGVVDL